MVSLQKLTNNNIAAIFTIVSNNIGHYLQDSVRVYKENKRTDFTPMMSIVHIGGNQIDIIFTIYWP